MKKIVISMNIGGWLLFIVGVLLLILDWNRTINLPYFIGIQLFLLGLINVGLFMWLLYFVSDSIIATGYRILIVYLIVVIPLFIGILLYQWITDTTFIYSLQFPYLSLVFLIYPGYLCLYGFLRGRPNRLPGGMFHTVIIGVMVVATLFVHSIFIGLSGKSVTPIDLDNTSKKLVFVESSFIFSSTHEVYQKKNALFISSVNHHGTLTCNDGCITGHPEYFDWVWVDENTLQVSGGGSFETVTYYFDESE